ncbi:MAG TPA: hypothetical protein VMW87_13755 [Spirochaetia bacterium]|nr:hypothetical protein [Spirochaetia bacterium]
MRAEDRKIRDYFARAIASVEIERSSDRPILGPRRPSAIGIQRVISKSLRLPVETRTVSPRQSGNPFVVILFGAALSVAASTLFVVGLLLPLLRASYAGKEPVGAPATTIAVYCSAEDLPGAISRGLESMSRAVVLREQKEAAR